MQEDYKLVSTFLDRFEKLKSARANTENVWQEIADNCVSHGANFTVSTSKGDNSRAKNIFDITVIQAIDFLVSALHSGLTNPTILWFDLKMTNEMLNRDPGIQKFLEVARGVMMEVFNSSTSSFPSQNHEVLTSIVQYGPGCLLVEDLVDKGIRFSAIHISELYIAQNAFGVVDTVYRHFKMTARQMVQRWGESVHQSVLKEYDKSPDCEYDIIHIVEPKSDKMSSKNKAHMFVSHYIDVKNKHIIHRGGYYENPYIVARFSKFASEDYGRSPTWQTLPTVKLVNRMTETILKAAQLQTTPPLLLADDGVMMPLAAKPNGIIYGGISMDGTARVQPLNVGGNLNIGAEMLQAFQKQIRDSFFVDQLVMRDGPTMTATEVVQRQQEALKLLAPAISRLQTEYLTPLILKVFHILVRSGRLGQIPKEFLTGEFEIEYVGQVPLLQKAIDSQKFTNFIATISPLVQVSPQVLENFDLDAASRHIADNLSIWKDVIRTDKEVASIRQERAQQMQLQQGLAVAQQASDISSTLNKK